MVANFQSTVNIWSALGVVGDMIFDGPTRSAPYNLYSDGTLNVIGNAFTITSDGNPQPSGNSAVAGTAQVGGTGTFAGILINSKDYASYGTTGGPLNPTITLPDNSIGFLATMGYFVANLPGPANVGDLVTYDPATGDLNSISSQTQFTAAIAATDGGDVMTVSAVAQGNLSIGQLITGAGVAGGTYIASLGTGKGGTGTYILNTIDLQTVSSEAMTAPNAPVPSFTGAGYISDTTLTVSTASTGELQVGQLITGAGVAANTVITARGTGEGGTGTYTVNISQTVGSSGTPIAITGPSNLLVPNCIVDRFQTNSTGGLAVIKLTN